MTTEVLVQYSGNVERATNARQEGIQPTNNMLATQTAAFGVLNIIALFFEVMKLMVNDRNNEKLARQVERQMQIKHMNEVSDACKALAKKQIATGVIGGFLIFGSGALPIAGYLKGDWMLGKVSKFEPLGWKGLASLANYIGTADNPYKSMKFFKNVSKMVDASGRTSQELGNVFRTFSDGDQNLARQKGEISRSDHEEQTRTIDANREQDRHNQAFVDKVLDMDLRAASPAA